MLEWLLCVLLAASEPETKPVPAPAPTAEDVKFFETSIRPILVEHCQECHGEKTQWGSLRLDAREPILAGGDRGPAVVPGKPAESLLLLAVKQTDPDLQMPPKKKLTDRQIADLSRWIEQGAHFPAAVETGKRSRNPDHWSFQPPREHSLPTVKDAAWVVNPIDQFILAKLEAAGLPPAKPADKTTLLRRVTFDLTGLPPTPAEVAAFLADDSPVAYARVVNRLLESPAYGERWARHWLDVARYADSNGLDENVAHGNAWRYRDYVVESLNKDKPFDRFLIEQLAGDLLPAESEAQRHEQLIATGFLGLGAKVLAEVDETKMQMDIVDEQIDTVGRAFLGLTLGCARCHDHKFDPIDTADYYGLAGVFKSTKSMENYTKVAKWHENRLSSPEAIAKQAAYEAELKTARDKVAERISAAETAAKASLPEGKPAPEKLETLFPAETQAEIKTLKEAVTKLEKSPPEWPSAMGVTEDKIADVAIHIRGNHLKLGEIAPRHTPPVIKGPAAPEFPADASGRVQLANWLVDPQHPLTARVLVNRVWRWHFGTGLTRSTDNFGLLGEAPSHPELLDWLARRCIADGWSLKSLHRLIVTSNTYCQSSQPAEQGLTLDPENRLFGRANVRRLEAEALRDSLLAVSGQLDRTLGGTLLTVPNRGYLFDHTSKDLTTYDSHRRSLYLPIIRNNVYELFQLFDYPDAAVPTGDRATTTVAPQALLLLNSELVMDSADALADQLLAKPATVEERLQQVTLLAYGRNITMQELAEHQQFLALLEQSIPTETNPATTSGATTTDNAPAAPGTASPARSREQQIWSALCQVVLAANEFSYVR